MSGFSFKLQSVTEENIVELVDTFYGIIQKDDVLGAIFEREIDDWDDHLPKMYNFWSSVMLKTGRYNGRPLPAHMKIEGLSRDHFTHWLSVFHKLVHELYEKEIAEIFVEKSSMIAQSLQMALESIDHSAFRDEKPKPKGWIPVQ